MAHSTPAFVHEAREEGVRLIVCNTLCVVGATVEGAKLRQKVKSPMTAKRRISGFWEDRRTQPPRCKVSAGTANDCDNVVDGAAKACVDRWPTNKNPAFARLLLTALKGEKKLR